MNDEGVVTATYLWPDKRPFPDAIMLKDASALVPEGRSARAESYGRNTQHYARETKYAALVTDMYIRLLSECDGGGMQDYADRMRELSLEVPE